MHIMKMRTISFRVVLLALLVAGSLTSSTMSEQPVNLGVKVIKPIGGHGGHPKSPVDIPTVSLDGHTLYFFTPCDGCTLNLVDENDVVVYTLVIPAGTTSLVLPATLSGNFELQIIRGNYCFWGEITL